MDVKKYIKMKKPLDLSCLRYDQTGLFMKDIRGAVMPMDIFVLMCSAMIDESKSKVKVKKQLYDMGRDQGKQVLFELMGKDKLPLSSANLELALSQVAISGFGEAHILRFDNHKLKGVIKIENSSFATQYKKLFSVRKEPVDFFLAGVISGTLEFFFDVAFDVTETSCLVQGKPYCVFEVVSKKKR